MSVLTFNPPVPPDSPVNRKRQTRLKGVAFGDGYSQQVGHGINNRSDTLPLTWSDIPTAQVEALEAFFESVPAGGFFLWTAPRRSSPQKWSCSEWTRTYRSGQLDGFAVTLTEVFNLDD